MRRARVEFLNGSIEESPIRTSSIAVLDEVQQRDFIVQCLVKRLANFQGYVPIENVANLQVTKYVQGQHYGLHLDSFGNWSEYNLDRWSRATTGYGILEADCRKCGTQFPKLRTKWSPLWHNRDDHGWCRILDCEEEVLTVNAIPGSLLFWRSVDDKGLPEVRTLHAGLKLPNGTKAGVNVWTKITPSESMIH